MRILIISLITCLGCQLKNSQKAETFNDSIIMREAARMADSIFLVMNAGDTSKLNRMSKTTWIYDGQGNVIGGSQIKKGRQRMAKLTDSISNDYYILDSAHVIITAYNRFDKKMWSTDPYKDNSIREYRTKRPIIINYEFGKSPNYFPDKIKEGVKVIWITYNNTQFGFIDIKTGKYYYCGQD